MRIHSIAVEGLFGRFNHTIPLDQNERINAIHGPNGYGKTAVLQLVHALFNRQAEVLWRIPFDTLRVQLEDDIALELRQEKTDTTSLTGQREIRLEYTLRVPGHDPVVYAPKPDFFAMERWYDQRQTQQVLKAFEKRRPPGTLEPGQRWALILEITKEVFPEPAPFLLWTTTSVTHIGLLSARELMQASNVQAPVKRGRAAAEGPQSFGDLVASYADEVRTAIQDAHLHYARTALTLESSFPSRALTAGSDGETPSTNELAQTLADLQQRRDQLATLGLLPVHAGAEPPSLEGAEQARQDLIWLHLRDSMEKLQAFDALADKMIVLENIIDKRFPFKHLRIDVERGFIFESDNGDELAPDVLSAGERHQLLLLYQSLFKQPEGSLLLIDDPDAWLHPSWHEAFLHDLKDIVSVTGIDVLLATHASALIEACGERATELQAPA